MNYRIYIKYCIYEKTKTILPIGIFLSVKEGSWYILKTLVSSDDLWDSTFHD